MTPIAYMLFPSDKVGKAFDFDKNALIVFLFH